jgi:hypothetical protein
VKGGICESASFLADNKDKALDGDFSFLALHFVRHCWMTHKEKKTNAAISSALVFGGHKKEGGILI